MLTFIGGMINLVGSANLLVAYVSWEVIGLCSGGVSPYRLLRVPFLVGCLLASISVFALVWGEPWGIRGLRQLMSRSAQRALAGGVRIGEFNEWVPGVTFLAQDQKNMRLILAGRDAAVARAIAALVPVPGLFGRRTVAGPAGLGCIEQSRAAAKYGGHGKSTCREAL